MTTIAIKPVNVTVVGESVVSYVCVWRQISRKLQCLCMINQYNTFNNNLTLKQNFKMRT